MNQPKSPPPPRSREPRYTRAQELRGSVSFWTFAAAVAIYYAWQKQAGYPPSTHVNLLGYEGFDVSKCSLAINVVTGWLVLTGLFLLQNWRRLIATFPRTFHLLSGRESKDFYSAVPTTVLAGLLLLLTIVLALFNRTVTIETAGRQHVRVEVGERKLLIVSDPETGATDMVPSAEVVPDRPIQVALRGAASPVLVLRDQYNLLTLEARRPRRDGLSFAAEELELRVGGKLPEMKAGRADAVEEVAGALLLHGRLRFDRGVGVTIFVDGQEVHGTYFHPGELTACPESPPEQVELNLFWKEICNEREALSKWVGHGTVDLEEGATVFHSLPNYSLEIRFAPGELFDAGGKRLGETKEALHIIARKTLRRDQPATEDSAGTGTAPPG